MSLPPLFVLVGSYPTRVSDQRLLPHAGREDASGVPAATGGRQTPCTAGSDERAHAGRHAALPRPGGHDGPPWAIDRQHAHDTWYKEGSARSKRPFRQDGTWTNR